MLAGFLAACSNRASGNDDDLPASMSDAEIAARAAFVGWGLSHRVEYRDVSTRLPNFQSDRAIVDVRASVRHDPEDDWRELRLSVPVMTDERGQWQVPPVALIDSMARAEWALTDAGATRTVEPARPTPATNRRPTPDTSTDDAASATRPPMPPPPEGTVLYESDWTAGMDGWIGTPDWSVRDGMLVNDGSRSSRDPWIEAPVNVDPWQPMIVEFQANVTAAGYASYGLISRAGSAGWFHFGVRWDPGVGENGSHVVAMGRKVRRDTRMVHEELIAVPRDLAPGPHAFRAEFRDGVAAFLVDGEHVGDLTEGEFYAGEYMGLWAELTPLEVHYVRVTLI